MALLLNGHQCGAWAGFVGEFVLTEKLDGQQVGRLGTEDATARRISAASLVGHGPIAANRPDLCHSAAAPMPEENIIRKTPPACASSDLGDGCTNGRVVLGEARRSRQLSGMCRVRA